MENSYTPGKTDFRTKGVFNCEARLVWILENGRFSMQGEVWRPNKSDILMGGQCIDSIAKMFPDDAKLQRMKEVWERWHLNDMRAGTPAQEDFLRSTREEFPGYPESHFDWASKLLADAGLNPDPETGYKYGHSWLREEIPQEIIEEIMSW